MTPPDVLKPVPVPWWERGASSPYDRSQVGHPNAVSEHPHWVNPRLPGRKIQRQIARRLRSVRRAAR